jgi:hypothetical protein
LAAQRPKNNHGKAEDTEVLGHLLRVSVVNLALRADVGSSALNQTMKQGGAKAALSSSDRSFRVTAR